MRVDVAVDSRIAGALSWFCHGGAQSLAWGCEIGGPLLSWIIAFSRCRLTPPKLLRLFYAARLFAVLYQCFHAAEMEPLRHGMHECLAERVAVVLCVHLVPKSPRCLRHWLDFMKSAEFLFKDDSLVGDLRDEQTFGPRTSTRAGSERKVILKSLIKAA